ncbi:PoNe immunity protein domain-containing protein [Paraburkholderia tropica]|uniref:PoNe immunity protein domain-containing protein n=1 Tax=Paraburkholderia tropica TaxID=92647 RepID=UPI002AB1645C|nr:PoNe immunity protein domain-containing protein [Paraburkholderia tropica]
MTDFISKRRQIFLSEAVYRETIEFINNDVLVAIEGNKRYTNVDALSNSYQFIASNLWDAWQLRYTAGDDLSSLAQDLGEIVSHYEAYVKYYEGNFEPFILDDVIDTYVKYVNLLSAAILLHREDLVPRIYGLIQGGGDDGHDLVIEELLKFYLPGRPEIDEWSWDKPYRIALEALDEGTAAERERGMRTYVKAWYLSMKGRAGFWGQHTKISENNLTSYTGYWTMEAAALSYLFDIADSSYRDELVYPKDLADYARSQPRRTPEAALQKTSPPQTEAGQLCPREGWWSTAARHDSRRHFMLGEALPVIASAITRGITLWKWDDDQTVAPSAPLVQAPSGEVAPRMGLWRLTDNVSVRCYVQQGERMPLHQGNPVQWVWLEDIAGMRVRSGTRCPYPGIWTCEEVPDIELAFNHNVELPMLDGRAVTWRLIRTA